MEDPRSDDDLLRDYVDSRDQRAFRLLAERHSGLIYHTALRIWNDHTLAEDVSQRVLGVLAAKAANVLRAGVPLSAWLHRTSILEAKAARRREARHHRKKEALMQEPDHSSAVRLDSRWQDALPHLDAAIDALPEADRRVLLFHYFEGMTFPQVADRMKKSTVAVQKQSQRALARLQAILGKRGVALSIGIISTGLTAEMAKAAPLGIITAFCSKPLLAQTTTQVLVVKKTTVTAIAATVLLCGIPLAHQQVVIYRLESRLATSGPAVTEPRTPTRERGTVTGISHLRRLAKDLAGQSQDAVRYLAATDYIRGLTDEQIASLILECVTCDLSQLERQPVFKFACLTLGERDSANALNFLLDKIPSSFYLKTQTIYHESLTSCLREWVSKDPSGALAWFESHLDAIRLVAGSPMLGQQLENEMRLTLSHGFLFTEPSAAVEILRPVSAQMLLMEFDQLARSNSRDWNANKGTVIRIAREVLPEKEATRMISRAASPYINLDRAGMPAFTEIERFLGQYDLSTAEREAVILQAGVSPMKSAASDPEKLEATAIHYRKWLEGLGIEDADWQVGAALAQIQNNWGDDFGAICDLLAGHSEPAFPDPAIAGFLDTVDEGKCDFKRLRKLADQAGDPGKIHKMIDQLETPARR